MPAVRRACCSVIRSNPGLPAGLLAAALALSGLGIAGAARAQWVNAADQAAIMNQNSVHAGNVVSAQEGALQGADARHPPPAGDSPAPDDGAAAEIRRMMEARKQQLRPEYERRLQRDGRAAANAWLRGVASQMGRRDGQALRGQLR